MLEQASRVENVIPFRKAWYFENPAGVNKVIEIMQDVMHEWNYYIWWCPTHEAYELKIWAKLPHEKRPGRSRA